MPKNAANQSIKNLPLNYFIPMVCHYNENTLLTKNGRLMQTIAIKDVYRLGNAVTGFYDVRALLRQSINKHINSNKVAIWISTVRKEVDFSDDTVYKQRFAQDLKNVWEVKNSLKKRLVNDLYITIVYQHSSMKVGNWKDFISSFDSKLICSLHDKILQDTLIELNKVVENIQHDLKVFGADRLKVFLQDGKYVSALSSFLGEIIYFDKIDSNLKEVDLALDLAPSKYIVGNNTLELRKSSIAKYVSVIGLKEYQEVPGEKLHHLLGLDCPMIITELFSIIPKHEAQMPFKDLLQLSNLQKDEMLIEANRIKDFMDETHEEQFCTHQINISITEKDEETLQQNVAKVAEALSEIGLVPVKEDIDIEYAFWSRVPANFQLIKRNQSILKRYVGAFSCLYALSMGNYENVWGKPLTTFATSIGSTYSFNFHPQGIGHTLILGAKGSGRTILLNFLVTLSLKYQPKIMYVTSNPKSNALIDVLDGKLLNHLNLPNPFYFLEEVEIFEFLCALCGLQSISDEQSDVLLKIIQELSSLPEEQRFLSAAAKLDVLNSASAKAFKKVLKLFGTDQRYKDIFSYGDKDFNSSDLIGLDLTFFTEKDFEKNNYPKNERDLPQYREGLKIHKHISAAVVFLLFKIFSRQGANDHKKIMVLSGLDKILSQEYILPEYLEKLFQTTQKQNGIVMISMDSNNIDIKDGVWQTIINNVATRFLLSGETLIHNIANLMNLTQEAEQLYLDLPSKGNYFLIDQKDFTVTSEISLIDFPKIVQILALGSNELAKYNEIKALRLSKDEFLDKLYAAFEID